LVEVGAAPPTDWCDFEDWVRLPADELEVVTRVAGVESRAGPLAASPWIDELDLLRCEEAWVALSPLEARMMRLLLQRVRGVVKRDELTRAGWPSDTPGRERDLNTAMKSLRRKIRSLSLEIHTVAGRGYLVDVVQSHALDASTPALTA
jgi:two-component system response regulator MprA